MTDRITGTTDMPIISEFDVAAGLIIEMERNEEASERDAIRDARAEARAAGSERIGQMKEAADFKLVSGVVGGCMKIASAASSAAGTCTSAARTDGEMSVGDGSPAPDAAPGADGAPPPHATRHADFGDYSSATSKAAEGLGDGMSALLTQLGANAELRSERMGLVEGEARADADAARSDADAMARAADKITDAYAQVLAEKRRAEEAATRA